MPHKSQLTLVVALMMASFVVVARIELPKFVINPLPWHSVETASIPPVPQTYVFSQKEPGDLVDIEVLREGGRWKASVRSKKGFADKKVLEEYGIAIAESMAVRNLPLKVVIETVDDGLTAGINSIRFASSREVHLVVGIYVKPPPEFLPRGLTL